MLLVASASSDYSPPHCDGFLAFARDGVGPRRARKNKKQGARSVGWLDICFARSLLTKLDRSGLGPSCAHQTEPCVFQGRAGALPTSLSTAQEYMTSRPASAIVSERRLLAPPIVSSKLNSTRTVGGIHNSGLAKERSVRSSGERRQEIFSKFERFIIRSSCRSMSFDAQ